MVEVSGFQGAPERSAETTRDVPAFTPPADIYETENALVAILEMPGVEANSLSITVDKRVLTIVGRSRGAAPREGYRLAYTEYRDGDYERSFTLSDAIDGERIEAQLRDGVLRITLPKATPAPAKTITVKAG